MIRSIAVLLILFTLFINPACRAESEFIAKIETGFIQAKKFSDYTSGKLDDIHGAHAKHSLIFGAELLYQPLANFRIGPEFQYSTHKFSNSSPTPGDGLYMNQKINIKTQALLFNFYFDLYKSNNIAFYVMSGAGLAFNKSSSFNQTIPQDEMLVSFPGKTKKSFAWQGGAGLRIPLNQKLSLDLSARYFNYGKTSTKNQMFINNVQGQSQGIIGTKLRGTIFMLGINILL